MGLIDELWPKLKPRIVGLIREVQAQSLGAHDLAGKLHTGTIGDSQAPQFLKADGSRMLIGNLGVADGVQVDGVDVSAHKSETDVHTAATAAAGHTGGVGGHTHQDAAGGGKLDHGAALSGLGDDDHPQYINSARHDTPDRHALGTVVPHDSHAALGGLGADDHAQYLRTDGGRAVSGNLLPDLTDTRDLGASDRLWRKGWVSEFDAVVFAKNTQTLVGGYLMIGKGEGALATNVAAADTQIDFGQAMTAGDFVVFRSAGQVEYVQVGALVSGTIYAVTRNLDGSGANNWPAGGVYSVLGQDGDGRIVLNAVETPKIQIFRQGTAYNLATVMGVFGDLNGWGDFTAEEYGTAIGDYANGNYLRYGPSRGFKLCAGNGGMGIDETGFSMGQGSAGPGSDPVAYALKWLNGSWIATQIFSYTYDVAGVNTLVVEANYPWDVDIQHADGLGQINLQARGKHYGGSSYLLNLWMSEKGLSLYEGSDATKASIRAGGGIMAGSGYEAYEDLPIGHVVASAAFRLGNDYLHQPDGWRPAGETWTYASATTFTIAGDARAKYPIGTKIKLTQSSTVKYLVVVATSYSSPNTTITVTGGSNFSLANATISGNYLSYLETPQGFPNVFAWTPVCTGFSSAPTWGAVFSVAGGMCKIVVYPTGPGTSNATTFTMTVPIKSRASTVATLGVIAKLANGSAIQATPGLIELSTNTDVANLYTNSNNGAWTASGNKFVYLTFEYPIK